MLVLLVEYIFLTTFYGLYTQPINEIRNRSMTRDLNCQPLAYQANTLPIELSCLVGGTILKTQRMVQTSVLNPHLCMALTMSPTPKKVRKGAELGTKRAKCFGFG